MCVLFGGGWESIFDGAHELFLACCYLVPELGGP